MQQPMHLFRQANASEHTKCMDVHLPFLLYLIIIFWVCVFIDKQNACMKTSIPHAHQRKRMIMVSLGYFIFAGKIHLCLQLLERLL